MIKASLTRGGRQVFVLGLSARNIELLRQGKPIPVNLAELGGKGEVLIMYGETEEDIADELRKVTPLPGDASA